MGYYLIPVANYDYGLYYYFYQDGTIQYEVKATGELNTHVLAEDEVHKDIGVKLLVLLLMHEYVYRKLLLMVLLLLLKSMLNTISTSLICELIQCWMAYTIR